MKKLLLTLTLMMMTGVATQSFEVNAQKNATVYVCTGPKATRYHASSGCRGLNRCSGEIVSMEQAKASKSGYTPCKICY